eukprot:TRINITY_DN77247_c0_g1_i1.p1 TRINITY_DN77247_c0_g1~~TRINITY_DN77247_c0_g1_i1.p1  ORF type:complete len:241 (-),score=20.47 TRINITY_DN77247_c0_g1_i1:421-1143(-)
MSGEKLELLYWPFLAGRAEPLRLILEEAGAEYTEPAREVMKAEGKDAGIAYIVDLFFKGGNKDFPCYAPPAIRKGKKIVNHTQVAAKFLGRELGMDVASEWEFEADAVAGQVTDFVSEGRTMFHPKEYATSYYEQKEEAAVTVAYFEKERLHKHVGYFERLLKHTGANGTTKFLFGDKITWIDLLVFYVLDCAANQFKEAYEKLENPLCVAWVDAIKARPRIAEYMKSDRKLPWEGNSMM